MSCSQKLDESAEKILSAELSPDEQLLWAARPRQGFVLRAADAFLIPFSLLWGGSAIFWEVGVIEGGAPWILPLFGVPFVLIGLYIMVGRFWVDARQRARTIYAVTSERVIIVSGFFGRRVKSLSIDTISDLSLTEHGHRRGTVTFAPVLPFYYRYRWFAVPGWPGFGHHMAPSLELIRDARQVYEIIRGAQRAAKQRA